MKDLQNEIQELRKQLEQVRLLWFGLGRLFYPFFVAFLNFFFGLTAVYNVFLTCLFNTFFCLICFFGFVQIH